jgi:hypothetical protein
MKITTKEIEVALCAYPISPFYCRKWIVVPRVSWGLESHECDILALSNNNYAHEIEIKTSVSDLKADFKKRHHHESIDNKIRCLWYAAPIEMQAEVENLVPQNTGIILVYRSTNEWHTYKLRTEIIRKASPKTSARKFTDEEKIKLYRLGTMRYWTIIKREIAAKYDVKVEK